MASPFALLRLATVLRRHAALLEASATAIELHARSDIVGVGVAAIDRAKRCATPERAAEQVAEAFLTLASTTLEPWPDGRATTRGMP